MEVNGNDSLKYWIFSLKLFGLWAPDNPMLKKIYRFYSFLAMFMVFGLPVYGTFYAISEGMGIVEFMDEMYLVPMMYSNAIKPLTVLLRAGHLKKVVQKLGAPPLNKRRPDQNIFIEEASKTVRMITVYLLTSIISSLIFWIFAPMFEKKRALPIAVWLPFDPLGRYYVAVYIYLSISGLFMGMADSAADALFASLMVHATGQLKIVKHSLENLKRHVDVDENDPSYDEKVYRQIVECIKHHEAIVELVKNIESSFGIVAFVQFSAGSIIICAITYEISIMDTDDVTKIFVAVLLLIFFMFEIGFICWYAEDVYRESLTLNDSIYLSDWYFYGPKSKKALLLFMESTKRPLHLRALKMFKLSLETFTMILRRSYSLYAVLQTRSTRK